MELKDRALSPHVTVWGNPAVFLYWVEGTKGQALIDAGYTANAFPLGEWVTQRRIPERPFFHLLTHSHFDHIGATPWLRKSFPEMRIFAHPRLRRVLGSPRALALIQQFSQETAKHVGVQAPPFEPFDIDTPLTDGLILDLGDVKIQAIETPGHTRDSVSFWIEPDGILIPGEAVGVPDLRGEVRPQFLASYTLYLQSLQRLADLDIQILGLPHRALVEGREAVRSYMHASLRNTLQLAQWIETRYKQKPDVDAVFQDLLQHPVFGTPTGQTQGAFLFNLRTMVIAVARETGKTGR